MVVNKYFSLGALFERVTFLVISQLFYIIFYPSEGRVYYKLLEVSECRNNLFIIQPCRMRSPNVGEWAWGKLSIVCVF